VVDALGHVGDCAPCAFHTVLQRRPLIIEPGGLEGGVFESGLLKMGIEGGGGSLMS